MDADRKIIIVAGPHNCATHRCTNTAPNRCGKNSIGRIEMRGRWKKHEPMSGEDFQPLASDRIAVDPNVDDPGRYRVAL